MRIYPVITVACDRCERIISISWPATTIAGVHKKQLLDQALRDSGWVYISGGLDVCPKCQRQEERE